MLIFLRKRVVTSRVHPRFRRASRGNGSMWHIAEVTVSVSSPYASALPSGDFGLRKCRPEK